MTNRTRNWYKRWIRNHALDVSPTIADERLNFAPTRVIRRWFEQFRVILSSVNPLLMCNFCETMVAADLRGCKVRGALDQRVFRKKHKKPHHCTLGAVFNPLGHGRLPPL
jgi:hypothetical protein